MLINLFFRFSTIKITYTCIQQKRVHDPSPGGSSADSRHGPSSSSSTLVGGHHSSRDRDRDRHYYGHLGHGRDAKAQYVCYTCGRTDSPEWRRGPTGPKTLCNACGLRWAKHAKLANAAAANGGASGAGTGVSAGAVTATESAGTGARSRGGLNASGSGQTRERRTGAARRERDAPVAHAGISVTPPKALINPPPSSSSSNSSVSTLSSAAAHQAHQAHQTPMSATASAATVYANPNTMYLPPGAHGRPLSGTTPTSALASTPATASTMYEFEVYDNSSYEYVRGHSGHTTATYTTQQQSGYGAGPGGAYVGHAQSRARYELPPQTQWGQGQDGSGAHEQNGYGY